MNTLQDELLGELTYNYGWVRNEMIDFLGEYRIVKIIFVSYDQEGVTQNQKEQYQWFKKNLIMLNNDILDKIKAYILNEYQIDGFRQEYLINEEFPVQIIFEKNEKNIGIAFESRIDEENGIGVKIEDNKIVEVGYESIVL